MNDEDGWYAILEFLVQSLVMPNLHAEPCPDAATKCSQSQKSGFADTPFRSFCLPLVNTEHEEGDYIYHNEVEDKRFAQKREKFHVT